MSEETAAPRVAGYAVAKLLERVREDEVLREQSERIAAYAGERGWDLTSVYTDAPSGSVGTGARAGTWSRPFPTSTPRENFAQ